MDLPPVVRIAPGCVNFLWMFAQAAQEGVSGL
jgi:hypothetical protein